jgi:hypothetical protein
MPEYVRMATFEMDDAALAALVQELRNADGPPEGMNATRLIVLADRSAGKVMVGTRFPSEEDMRTGSAMLEGMSPPDEGNRRRTAVEVFEVAYEMVV